MICPMKQFCILILLFYFLIFLNASQHLSKQYFMLLLYNFYIHNSDYYGFTKNPANISQSTTHVTCEKIKIKTFESSFSLLDTSIPCNVTYSYYIQILSSFLLAHGAFLHTSLKKIKYYPGSYIYNHFHNILRLFDVLTNFLFTTSETMCNYYL